LEQGGRHPSVEVVVALAMALDPSGAANRESLLAAGYNPLNPEIVRVQQVLAPRGADWPPSPAMLTCSAGRISRAIPSHERHATRERRPAAPALGLRLRHAPLLLGTVDADSTLNLTFRDRYYQITGASGAHDRPPPRRAPRHRTGHGRQWRR
jgi:hypothetical protein